MYRSRWLTSLQSIETKYHSALDLEKSRKTSLLNTIIVATNVPLTGLFVVKGTTTPATANIINPYHSQKGGQSQPSKQDTLPRDKQTASKDIWSENIHVLSNRFKHLHRGHYTRGLILPWTPARQFKITLFWDLTHLTV
jgi:hypothetical protein